MAIPSFRYWALAIATIASILLFAHSHRAAAQGCGDVHNFVSQCLQFVSKSGPKVEPSSGCCEAVKGLDVPCACKLVTKEFEHYISMEKVIYVVQSCGISIPPGMQCGSYIVPLE